MKNLRTLIVCLTGLLFSYTDTFAQQFIDKAVIEYEVKTNIKKTMGNSNWAEMVKENLPQFKTGYYSYTFANNKSVYKFDRWDEKAKVPEWMRKSDEENVWYVDFEKGIYNMQKDVFGSMFNVEDSIIKINWQFSNESRVIAGFNCRKAIGKIFDSVYVFAFYTDEITIPGGPCSINGLPGMILGLTIPRMYTSFIATKINVNTVAEENIKPAKAKKYYTTFNLKTTIIERTKDWRNNDDEESKKWREQFYWGTLL
jgi:GLPGLI family protein